MKVIKVIDLLNKIANNEDLPKKIKYNETIYKYQESICGKGYVNTDGNYKEWFSEMLNDSEEDLNDEVELLEDEEIDIQEIEEIKTLGCNIETDDGMIIPTENLACDYIVDKINEIIRVVNRMQTDNKIKEK